MPLPEFTEVSIIMDYDSTMWNSLNGGLNKTRIRITIDSNSINAYQDKGE